jgi:O-antigen/teichoic acid export membrane protein
VRRALAGGALASVVAQVALLVGSAVVSIAVARILGPSDTGRYGVAATLFALLAPASTIGLRSGILYFISREEWSAGRALKESQLSALALGFAASLLTVPIYVLWKDGPLQGLGGDALAVTLVAVTAFLLWTFSVSILLALERYEAYGLTHVVLAATGIVAGVGLMIPFGVVGALSGLAISQLSAALFAATSVIGIPGAREAARGRIQLGVLKRAIRFGSLTSLSEIFWALSFRLDVVVLNAYVAASTVGVYFVAGSLGAIAWVLPGALQSVILPRVAALEAASERGEAEQGSQPTVARSMRHAVLLTAPTAAGLSLLLVAGVPLLYGPKFHDAVLFGFLLLPGVLAGGIGKVAAGNLIGWGRPGYTLLPQLLITPPTVGAYLLVIPEHGAEGAAIVSSISYSLSTAVAVWLLMRVTRMPLRAMLVPRRGDAQDYVQMTRALGRYARSRTAGLISGR